MKTEQDRKQVLQAIKKRALPSTVEIIKGLKRSNEQNRLQRLWMKEAEAQGDQTAEEYRGYCKLHFGVPIMCNQSELYAEKYAEIVAPLPYHQKMELMMLPLDFPVTRIMSAKSKKQYLDAIYTFFTAKGMRLTNPDWLGL